MFAFESAMVVTLGNGGTALGFAQTVSKAVAGIKDVDTVITGHGPVLPWKAYEQYQRFNRDIVAWAQEAKKAGKSVDDAAVLIHQLLFVSGNYRNYQFQPYRIKIAAQTIYDELNATR